MATIWAGSNGNWDNTTPSVWKYYNETTQDIETYPYTAPLNGDIVYCNGKTITVNKDFNIGVGLVSNESVEIKDSNNNVVYTTIQGGFLKNIDNISRTMTANFRNVANYIFTVASSSSIYIITGNVFSSAGTAFNRTGSSGGVYWSLTGNAELHNSALFSNSNNYNTASVIGNLTIDNSTLLRTGTRTLTLVGSITCLTSTNDCADTATISGNIVGESTNACIRVRNLTLGGSITYKSSNPAKLGITGFDTLNIQNPDTFIWKDVSEPRINPFIILTDAELNNHQQYPSEADVRKDVEYAWGALKGQLEQVQVGCVTKEDVRDGVPLIGMYEDGQQVVGTIIIPAEEDVREGVHYDNDKIGTLIVQGGGDRLRIADFGYYTNAQSDTYIVDITEADKPKFASAEERILIEMFPTLDLDNIPEMYFDDLFVKYLKYRLIVEYYRTAGVNSTFTPSEPTTEIVNYRNVTCEVWLNSANTYLNAWNKKFGLNKPPQKVRL